jgi:hypothetical protein
MRRALGAVLAAALASPPAALAVGADKTMYVGGTLAEIPQGTEGRLSTSGDENMVFVAEKGGALVEIPYKRITDIEYGQKAGRAVHDYVLIGLGAFLFKHRKHYLTVSYSDKNGKDQAAIFELGKDTVRTTLAVVETRSGRKVIYQDEEAAKSRAN